jgi:hypothetical protein
VNAATQRSYPAAGGLVWYMVGRLVGRTMGGDCVGVAGADVLGSTAGAEVVEDGVGAGGGPPDGGM